MIKLNIKKLRIHHGWSQLELAKKSNLSPAAICQFEKGERYPTSLSLYRLAKAFDLKIDDLIEGEVDVPRIFTFKGSIHNQDMVTRTFQIAGNIFPLDSSITFKFCNLNNDIPYLIDDNNKLWEITIKEIL